MPSLTLGYSPCPNDTFIFYALVHGRIGPDNITYRVRLEDVETLNLLALGSELDVTKVSFHAFGFVRDNYVLLRSGGALGKNCGPLLIASQDIAPLDVAGEKIAIPGMYTTAHLLLNLYLGSGIQVVAMPFFQILDAVQKGICRAGLVIHEGRFTYHKYGLNKILDLGQWWEATTGLPIPLGGIIARRALGVDMIKRLESLIKSSITYSLTHREEPKGYIRSHAQEMDEQVIKQHIDLYVNSYSLNLEKEGRRAVEHLFALAEEQGLVPKSTKSLFMEY